MAGLWPAADAEDLASTLQACSQTWATTLTSCLLQQLLVGSQAPKAGFPPATEMEVPICFKTSAEGCSASSHLNMLGFECQAAVCQVSSFATRMPTLKTTRAALQAHNMRKSGKRAGRTARNAGQWYRMTAASTGRAGHLEGCACGEHLNKPFLNKFRQDGPSRCSVHQVCAARETLSLMEAYFAPDLTLLAVGRRRTRKQAARALALAWCRRLFKGRTASTTPQKPHSEACPCAELRL